MKEYNFNSHLIFGITDNNLRYIKKDSSTWIDDHINKFQCTICIHKQCRPPNYERLDDSMKNTLFLMSLDEDYNTFYQSVDREIETVVKEIISNGISMR